jgi:predicted acylesterase/phospholipase RssA
MIVEALCATITTPPLFSPIKIGPHLMEQSYVGGGLGSNNPTRELLKEATSVFGKDRPVAQILSLGSGKPRALSLNTSASTVGINQLLEDMTTDCEVMAHELSTRLTRLHSYLRLNVDRGMEDLSIKHWGALGPIEGHTKVYVENPHIAKDIEASLVCLKDRIGILNLGEISM